MIDEFESHGTLLYHSSAALQWAVCFYVTSRLKYLGYSVAYMQYTALVYCDEEHYLIDKTASVFANYCQCEKFSILYMRVV
jgi:hypothetical protein